MLKMPLEQDFCIQISFIYTYCIDKKLNFVGPHKLQYFYLYIFWPAVQTISCERISLLLAMTILQQPFRSC